MPLRIKLVGSDPELLSIQSTLSSAGLNFGLFDSLDDACDSHIPDPADVFVVGASNYFQSSLNQIHKLSPEPEVILALGEKMPNLAKILIPHTIHAESNHAEILWYLEHTSQIAKRRRRLSALRDHQKRSWGQGSNPAINLVTALMRKCTVAEDFPDLLSSVSALKGVIDFQDCTLATMDGDRNLLGIWHGTVEGKDKFVALNSEPLHVTGDVIPPEGKVEIFSNSHEKAEFWSQFTLNPWCSALVISFSAGQIPPKKGIPKSGFLILFRRELFPFVDRDVWLYELTSGPFALALEKIVMLKMIGQASKEWRSTFDGISEPLTVIDSTYQIVKANKAFAALVDQDIKKLKGRRCYSLLANRRSPCVGCPVNREVQPQGGTRLQISGKTKKDLLAWSYGIRTKMESYHFQFYRNVSKEAALTSTLIQSEKMAALGRLVGAVAHEINNPLAGILATSQILLQDNGGEPLSDDLRSDVEEIRSAAWRSKKIIDDLLGFTSPEERKMEAVDPAEIIKTTLVFCKSALKDVRVSVDVETNVPKIFVSGSGLQQVIFNLLTNAVHAMNGRGAIHITVKRREHEVSIGIRDEGPGITTEKLKHIFDPFYTSKQEGAGTGLGLSIVKSLTQKMNARIEVESALGKGTEFTLFLPCAGKGDSEDGTHSGS